jgi:1-acyl-sn-glycerol-3-phosphate acyltransferase
MPKWPPDFRYLAWYWLWFTPLYWLSFLGLTLGFSLRMERRRGRFPRTGPVLVLANHQSFFDPIMLGLASPRPLVYLARKTLFKPPWFAWLISSLNAVPVDQEGVAKEGFKAILKHLQAGEAVVVFPEGTRTETGALSPLKPGVQLLIKRLRMPIVPMGIAGAFEALAWWEKVPRLSPLFGEATRSSVAVTVGEPIDSQRYAGMPREQMLAELTAELQKVKDRAERLRRKR